MHNKIQLYASGISITQFDFFKWIQKKIKNKRIYKIINTRTHKRTNLFLFQSKSLEKKSDSQQIYLKMCPTLQINAPWFYVKNIFFNFDTRTCFYLSVSLS